MFCTFTSALPAVCLQCTIWLFLHFLNLVFSRYVAQVLSWWIWNGSSCPYFYRYHLCFHIPYAPNFYYEVLMLKSSQLLSWSHFCLQELQHLLICMFLVYYTVIIIIIIIIIQYVYLLSQAFLPGTSLEPAVIPTAQASSFTLQYFPYYVWCSKYSCLLYWIYRVFSWYSFQIFL